ncbi:MAG: 3'(2'),5'-bisphosphate nucleotidase CysQ [Pseudomonas sp.]
MARAAALEAGRAVMRSFGTRQSVIYKSPDQPQTHADLEADRILHEMLLGARPEYGWLSEETIDRPDRLNRECVWIVDPIDGTRSFVSGRPEFAISIGLANDGEVVLGVVANPATAELYWAVDGGGAFSADGTRLHVSQTSVAQGAMLMASRSELADREFADFGDEWRITPLGSTAYKLAHIAAGHGDVFLSRGPKSEWDVCAGDLIVREAGGRVTDLRGRALRFNQPDPYVHGILGTNGRLHDMALNIVKQMPDTGRLRGFDDGSAGGAEEGE